MEKCGFNILLLLPVTGASGAGSHTAISPTQHKAHSRQDRLLTMYPDHLSLVWPPVLPHSLAMASCQLSCGDLCCGGDTNQKAGYHPANTCSQTARHPVETDTGISAQLRAGIFSVFSSLVPTSDSFSDAVSCTKPIGV